MLTWAALISFYNKYRNLILIVVGIVVLIGLALFLWGVVDRWRFTRDLERRKANVNIALTEANRLQSNVNIDKALANKIIENVNIATQEYANSVNATEHQRAITNAALRRMQEARNVNRSVNAHELEELLKQLD